MNKHSTSLTLIWVSLTFGLICEFWPYRPFSNSYGLDNFEALKFLKWYHHGVATLHKGRSWGKPSKALTSDRIWTTFRPLKVYPHGAATFYFKVGHGETLQIPMSPLLPWLWCSGIRNGSKIILIKSSVLCMLTFKNYMLKKIIVVRWFIPMLGSNPHGSKLGRMNL